MTSNATLATIATDVRSGEISIDYALGWAYALGYSAGKVDCAEETPRIVRVGNEHSPEIKSDAH
jgi:hypothetical protein